MPRCRQRVDVRSRSTPPSTPRRGGRAWLNAPVLKTGRPLAGLGGSNPSPSAKRYDPHNATILDRAREGLVAPRRSDRRSCGECQGSGLLGLFVLACQRRESVQQVHGIFVQDSRAAASLGSGCRQQAPIISAPPPPTHSFRPVVTSPVTSLRERSLRCPKSRWRMRHGFVPAFARSLNVPPRVPSPCPPP